MAVRLDPVLMESLPPVFHRDAPAAFSAFRRQATEIMARGSGFGRPVTFGGAREDWTDCCSAALATPDLSLFFQTHFKAFEVSETERPQGLFTGYFEPQVDGSLQRTDEFTVPVLRRPSDLVAFTPEEEAMCGFKYGRRVDGRPEPYYERQEIENGKLFGRGLEICWLNSWVEAFFVHIQGSGRVQLQDGRSIRLSYAAKTGLPYTGIGGVLADRGALSRETMSMKTVKAWMADHPQDARHLMWLNKSYVFFREITVEDASLGAVGAAQVHLTPLRSMAVDRASWMFGTPMWVETTFPPEAGKSPSEIRRLMIAQDTGSAIKGHVRGDFYWGWGEDAALIAGHMKSPGRMTVLLPKPVVKRLGLPQ
jgi:membrane-bound lytic murein transglycosylase A